MYMSARGKAGPGDGNNAYPLRKVETNTLERQGGPGELRFGPSRIPTLLHGIPYSSGSWPLSYTTWHPGEGRVGTTGETPPP